MYIILAGKHPLYVKGEKLDSYAAKLKDPQWAFPANFSPLARSLFLSMVKTNALERYTAKDALSHPWITRRPGDLPRSYVEAVSFERSKEKLHAVSAFPNPSARPGARVPSDNQSGRSPRRVRQDGTVPLDSRLDPGLLCDGPRMAQRQPAASRK